MDAELKDALYAVILEQSYNRDSWAAESYAQAALSRPRTGQEMEDEELRVQLLYVLNNILYWRGERAREVKAILRRYASG